MVNPQKSEADFYLRRNRNFLLLFAAQIVSLLGSGVTTVGLALFAYQLTGGELATAVIGNALFLRILAFLLFSQPAGVLADRVSRKAILIWSDVLRFGLLALFPLVTEVWQIYVLIFLINGVTAFFTPTFEACLPEVVGEKHYVEAVSYSRIAINIEAFASPALAGLLVAMLGVRLVFWFDAATYLFSALLVLLTALPLLKSAVEELSFSDFAKELTVGTRIILREPSLRSAIILSFAEALAGAAAIVATVVYVRDVLSYGDTAFSLVMAGLGFGSTISAIVMGRTTGRFEKDLSARETLHGKRHVWTRYALIIGGVILGLLLLPGIFKPSIAVFAVMWFLNGAAQSLIGISSSTLLAEHTNENERGKAYAAHFALTHACWLVTYPAIGYGAAYFGTPITFTIAGVICLLTTAVAFLSVRESISEHTHK